MKIVAAAILFIGSLLQIDCAQADDLDSASEEALIKTQELLKNRDSRTEAISKDPKGIQVDEFTKKLTGNAALTEDVYALAAEVLSIVVKDANGDVVKMQEALEKFSRNPASFAETWTPEQKAKLAKLGGKLPQAPSKP